MPANGFGSTPLTGLLGQRITPAVREQLLEKAADMLAKSLPAEVLFSREEEAGARQREMANRILEAVMRKQGVSVGPVLREGLVRDLLSRVVGLGFLDDLLPPYRDDLSEVALNPGGEVWVMKRGSVRFERLLEATGHPVKVHPGEAMRVINSLLALGNRSLTEASPSVDARLPQTPENPAGGRVKAIHPAICGGPGPTLNIRLFEAKPLRMDRIVKWGMAAQDEADLLIGAVRNGLRVLIVGGTKIGKTTFLSALANSAILPEKRVVKVEDPKEIYLDLPNVVTLEARPAPPGAQVPPYRIKDGVDDALRMSPDVLIVGEARTGDVASALFRAMMTDHQGLSTFHADGPDGAAFRLALIMFSDAGIRMEPAKGLIAQAVDLLVVLEFRDGKRAVQGIYQVEPELKGGNVRFTPISKHGEIVGQITRRR